jgi:hypothetical protein
MAKVIIRNNKVKGTSLAASVSRVNKTLVQNKPKYSVVVLSNRKRG